MNLEQSNQWGKTYLSIKFWKYAWYNDLKESNIKSGFEATGFFPVQLTQQNTPRKDFINVS